MYLMATRGALPIIASTDTFRFKSVTSERICFRVLVFNALDKVGCVNATKFEAAKVAQGKE